MAETSMPEAQEENKADVEVSEEPAVEKRHWQISW